MSSCIFDLVNITALIPLSHLSRTNFDKNILSNITFSLLLYNISIFKCNISGSIVSYFACLDNISAFSICSIFAFSKFNILYLYLY